LVYKECPGISLSQLLREYCVSFALNQHRVRYQTSRDSPLVPKPALFLPSCFAFDAENKMKALAQGFLSPPPLRNLVIKIF
jgi:hypothetical protein